MQQELVRVCIVIFFSITVTNTNIYYKVYEFENKAHRALLNNQIQSSIEFHKLSLAELNIIITNQQPDINDDFNVMESLHLLKNQINNKIVYLENLSISNNPVPDPVKSELLDQLNVQKQDDKFVIKQDAQITKVEHQLQLLKFKPDVKQQEINDLLVQLNTLYYNKMKNYESILEEILNK